MRCLVLNRDDFQACTKMGLENLLESHATERKTKTSALLDGPEDLRKTVATEPEIRASVSVEPAAQPAPEAEPAGSLGAALKSEMNDPASSESLSYQALVEMNTSKCFRGYDPTRLEEYLSDTEFQLRFNMDKVSSSRPS